MDIAKEFPNLQKIFCSNFLIHNAGLGKHNLMFKFFYIYYTYYDEPLFEKYTLCNSDYRVCFLRTVHMTVQVYMDFRYDILSSNQLNIIVYM